MTAPRGPVRWLHLLGFGKPRPEESVELEVEHHLAELADRLVAEGWSPEDARIEAVCRFGDRQRYVPRMKRAEQAQLVMGRWAGWLEVLRQSVVSVARTARREPGFTAGVVVTLGLGIGANATMYGIIDRLLLRPPEHIVEPERVVRVYREVEFVGRIGLGGLAYPDYTDLRAHAGLAGVAGYGRPHNRLAGVGESVTQIRAAFAAAELFPLLGVSPVIGRFYTSAEATPGSEPTVVLSSEYWRRAYAADPGVLGRTLYIDGRNHTIVGVAPLGFTGVELDRVDVWLPLELTQTADGACLDTRNCYWLTAVARLAAGVSSDAAADEATRLIANAREAANEREGDRVVLGPLIAARGPDASAESLVTRWLAGVSLIVLLIACANVANLLMARGTRRRREIGVRLALGAGRRVVVGGAMVESLALAALGGLLAIVIARWGGEVVRSTLFPDLYLPGSSLTPRLFAFTAVAVVIAGLFAGIVPALQGTRADVARGLYRDGLGSSHRRSSLRGALTVTQAAMTVVLLVGAGLFVASLGRIRAVDMGLDVDRLVTVSFFFTNHDLTSDRRVELYEEAARRAMGLPSVRSAAATASGLGSSMGRGIRAQGVDSIPRLPGGGPYQNSVSPGYFETVGLRVTSGREIGASDSADGGRVAVVSDLMARTLWPNGNGLGQCLFIGGGSPDCTRVVGVVEEAARNGFRDAPAMAFYLPASQTGSPHNTTYVRTEGRAEDIVDEVATVLRSISPDVRYTRVETLRERLDPQARSWTLGATMFSIFGLLALIVAAIGLYSVLAFDVAQRTRELGIRTALGARKARLMRSVLYQGARLGGAGVVLGLGVAYFAAPYAQDLLFAVSPRDPLVLGGVGLVLLLVSVAASLVPGLRATRVDPMRALKTE